LLGLECFRGVASPSSHSSFREEVFSRVGFCSGVCAKRRAADTAAPTTRMRWTGQIFWLLAYDACVAPHLLPAFTPEMLSTIGPMGSCIQLQQRNCSRFSRDFLRRSTFLSSQRTGSRTTGLRFERQAYLIPAKLCCHVERSRDIFGLVCRDSSTCSGMTQGERV